MDCVISGALDYGEDFMVTFIESTEGWDNSFENERVGFNYRSISKKQFEDIDKINLVYKNLLPEIFNII